MFDYRKSRLCVRNCDYTLPCATLSLRSVKMWHQMLTRPSFVDNADKMCDCTVTYQFELRMIVYCDTLNVRSFHGR